MAFKLNTRVLETFDDLGTGTVTLDGAVSGYKTFASELSNADTCFYFMVGGSDYEFGRGTYSAGTLARTSVLGSSNADAAVNWAAGTKTVGIAPLGPSDMNAAALAAYTDLLLGAGTTLLPLARMAGVILSGCELSNNGTDATNDIDIAAGYVVSDDGAAVMQVAAITKRLDAAWAVGSGNGGLDTGSIANTTYHMWAIQRSDTLVVDVLFSASASAPTMPANYDRKAYIGAVLRESAALVAFTQRGAEFLRKVPVNNVNATNPGTSAVTVALSVPTGIVVDAIIAVLIFDASPAAATTLLVSALSQTDTVPSSLTAFTMQVDNGGVAVSSTTKDWVRTDTSAQIRYRLSNSDAGVVFRLSTFGWINRAMKRLGS